jgi:hypothetical protein
VIHWRRTRPQIRVSSAEAGRNLIDRLGWRGYVSGRRTHAQTDAPALRPAEHLTTRVAPMAGPTTLSLRAAALASPLCNARGRR